MPVTKSTLWMIPWSVSEHCCFSSSLLIFETSVLKSQAEQISQGSHKFPLVEMVEYRIMLEVLDMSPEEEDSMLQTMRSTFE